MASSTSKNELNNRGEESSQTAVSHPQQPALIFLATFLGTLLIYWFTLAPDLTWANDGLDGGELITAAATLGIPHPPGYPTYALLGKLFSWLPVGSVAYRFNLFSAMATAVAAGVVSVISNQCSVISNQCSVFSERSPLITEHWLLNTDYRSLFTGLAFAFAPLVWGQAIITEVYGLNLAFLAAFLWALTGKRPSLLTGILLGLSVTTHLTSLFMIPLALSQVPRQQWSQLGVGLALGLAPLLTLPWLAQTNSPVVWGDPGTVRGWWWLVSGRLYANNLFAINSADLGNRLSDWSRLLFNQFTWAGVPLVAFAFYRVQGSARRLRLWLLGTAVLYLVYAFGYGSSDAIVFTLPALLLLSLLLAPGLRRLGRLALLLPFTLLLLNYSAMDLSRDRMVRPLAEQLLDAAPPGAILLTPGDQTIFTLWYYHHVEAQRPDLILVDANLFAFDWYRNRLQNHYPDLLRLEKDDLPAFRQTNEGLRPFCNATVQPQPPDQQLDCDVE